MSNIEDYLNTQPQLTPAVVGYFCLADKVLLGVRKQVRNGHGRLLISGIGGKVEPGEVDEEALVRECVEEIEARPVRWQDAGTNTYLYPHKPSWNLFVKVYRVLEWVGEPQETEVMRPLWYPQADLPVERMWLDNRYTVPEVLRGNRIRGVFLYAPDGSIAEHTLEIELDA